jgi:hypothetical protein
MSISFKNPSSCCPTFGVHCSLWLNHINPSEYRNNPDIIERLKKIADIRSKSPTLSVKMAAKTPMLFTQIRQPDCNYIAIPETSSERRDYIPIGYIDKNIIASNSLRYIPSDDIVIFGVLESSVHMDWMRTVCGRLKSDYRYSPSIYNCFPWPKLTEVIRKNIGYTAQVILDTRKDYSNNSLADLYDPLSMPIELRKAHEENDKAVMEAYGFDKNMTESEIVTELFKMYQALTRSEK